jgi:hypothetical protein
MSPAGDDVPEMEDVVPRLAAAAADQRAKSIVDFPPTPRKSPPTYIVLPERARQLTPIPDIEEEPSDAQLVPLQVATRSASVLPPASENRPPT